MSSKICREYISEVKTLFPVMSKAEKKYIKKLIVNVENCCQDNNIASKEELYKSYGMPNDVVNEYFSAVDTGYIIKKIKISKHIKFAVAIALTVAVIVSSTFCVVLYKGNQVKESAKAQITEIEDILGQTK